MTNKSSQRRLPASSAIARNFASWIASFAVLLLVSFGAAATTYSSYADARKKLSTDLQQSLTSSSISGVSWAKETNSGRMVKVLVLGFDSADPDLDQLRSAIVSAGGSVYYKYISINGISALLPASRVLDIARRGDVESISPNRVTARTQSLLEKSTGASTVRGAGSSNYGVDGGGVGIAFLDSGIMSSHRAFAGDNGATRVKKSVDFQKLTDAVLFGSKDWKGGYDFSTSIYPGSSTLAWLESTLNSVLATSQDPYGHGTLVASLAAGRSFPGTVDAGGVAPDANVYDVRVLNENGIGDVGDALAGIDWVIYHGKEYNIRVLNISLASDSTESYLTDPLCRAVRNAVAAGITVVVAAGNYGLGPDGQQRYGTISSPGNEPSAITVGSANPHATDSRGDDTVNMFSSRGPTRGGYIDAAGVRHADNILKPDLVAPGNRLPGALATDRLLGLIPSRLASTYPELVLQRGLGKGLMTASGTSFSAPVVAGVVALMLQTNPGLTPGLIKAILQYSAEPLPGANLLQQGTGLVNVPGALAISGALTTDIASRAASGSLQPGASMLAPGKSMPAPVSTIEGRQVSWSQVAFIGGRHVFTGDVLFRKFQGAYNPRITWVGKRVRKTDLDYFGNTQYISGFREVTASSRVLVTAGVEELTAVLGPSSPASATGLFIPVKTLSNALAEPGIVLSEGIEFDGGIVLSEGIEFDEGIVLSEGVVLSEGIILSEGVVLSEGILLSESGALWVGTTTTPFAGEP
jgi:serine protease AprX